jgi:hypothetical protein
MLTLSKLEIGRDTNRSLERPNVLATIILWWPINTPFRAYTAFMAFTFLRYILEGLLIYFCSFLSPHTSHVLQLLQYHADR